jgi:hypothetical protein
MCALSLPWPARAALCACLLAINLRPVAECVLLQGRAVTALSWREPGEFEAELGSRRVPAKVAAGSFRLGSLLVLRLQTPAGPRLVVIDGGLQEPRAFRRLCRQLGRLPKGGSGRSGEAC